jgi:hypothetical protein
MTTLQINIPDQRAAALKAYAQAQGLTVEKWLEQLVEQAPLDAFDEQATGAVVLAALQASPYRDIDLTPSRVPLANVRDVVL